MGGGARLLSLLKLSFLYIGASEFVNIRTQPPTQWNFSQTFITVRPPGFPNLIGFIGPQKPTGQPVIFGGGGEKWVPQK